MTTENTNDTDTTVNNPNKTPMKQGPTNRPDDAPASDVKSRAAEKDGLVANSTGLSFTSVSTGQGNVMAAQTPTDMRDALANNLQDRFDSGYGSIGPISTPFGDIQTPIGAVLNGLGAIGNKNIQKGIRGGGTPVYGRGNNISIGYDPNRDIKDLKGVMVDGLFGGKVYSGQGSFNPRDFDNKGNRLPVQDNGGDNNVSALGNAVAAKPIIKKKQTEFAKANNVNPQQQNMKVRKPKAAGDGEGIDGALVRRTKTLQSNRRGILGRPDSKKKTLLGS